MHYPFVALAGQITGASPAIPGMFPNMFPMATNQVFLFLFPTLVVLDSSIKFTIFLFVLLRCSHLVLSLSCQFRL
jgi:hypothetical protein